MHDLHEANKIVKLVLDKAQKSGLNKVKKIVIELGDVIEHGQTIKPENLKFNIDLLAENTIADGAEIVVNESDGEYWKLVEMEGE
jgi:Zn finger protein HypA/HybF involved in hydrogenase expression